MKNLAVLVAVLAGVALCGTAGAATYTWNTGSGSWDTSTANWTGAGTTWANGNDAVFGGTAGSTVTISETGITANSLDFNVNNDTIAGTATNNLTMSGSSVTVGTGLGANINAPIAGTAGLTKNGAGTLTLRGASTYSGTTSVLNGKLIVSANAPDGANGALGNDTSAILVGDTSGSNDAALIINQGTYTIGRDITVQAGSSGTATLGATSTTTTSTFSGDIALNKPIEVSSTSNTAQTVNFSGVISDGGGGFGLTKIGGGFVTLSGANTYTGATDINAGVLRLGIAENAGVSGPMGKSGTISFGGGTLQYSASNQYDYSSRFSTASNQAFNADLNGQNVTWASNLTNLGTSSLTVTGAGEVSLTGTNTLGSGGIKVGSNPSNTNVLSGALLIGSGSTSTTGVLTIGGGANSRPAIVTVAGGSLSAAGASLATGGGADVALRESSGSVTITGTASSFGGLPLFSIAGGTFSYGTLSLSAQGGYTGVFDVSGGTVSGGQANIGANNARAGLVTVRGGTFTASGMTLGSSGTNSFGTLVTSEGALDLGTATLNLGGGWGTTGYGTANLVGGTVKAGGIAKTGTGSTTANLTFSGGTLQATQSSATFLQGLTGADIYVGGATIDTQGFDVTIAQPLLGNLGNGVLTIPVANGGSGYITPPKIAISGGGGSGATAVANLDQNGVVESITVTNPGVNYTAPSTLSYTITNAILGSGFAVTDGTGTLGDNTAGGLTKVGSGTLTLSATNTYTGATTIQGGTLALVPGGSIDNSAGIVIGAGATFDVSALTSPYAMSASQPFTIDVDPTSAGLAGLIDAGSLDITNGDVTFNLLGVLDDATYVIADYVTLIGTGFGTVSAPTGYTIDYNYLGGNQIALVEQAAAVPEPAALALVALGVLGLVARRR